MIVTHGLHSNLGADMLFLKESIDATVKRAREDKIQRKAEQRKQKKPGHGRFCEDGGGKAGQKIRRRMATSQRRPRLFLADKKILRNAPAADDDDDDEEETVVRGFPGNAVKTENGIQYLGKRLAKYILRYTYPDQPFLPVKKGLTRALTDTFKSEANKAKRDGTPSHAGSSIKHPSENTTRPTTLHTSSPASALLATVSGGLIQTYAVAYIHKHSPGLL